MTILLPWLAVAVASARADSRPESSVEFDDGTVHVDLPACWRIEGTGGEYVLESDEQDAASLLLLVPESHRSLEERLADIEEQFLATGIIRLETSETRVEDGEEIFYRRYRLMMAGSEEPDSDEEAWGGTGAEREARDSSEAAAGREPSVEASEAAEDEDAGAILLHQYSFWRADVQVLLQIETVPERATQEDLFFRIFHTLEIHQVPDPFVFEDVSAPPGQG